MSAQSGRKQPNEAGGEYGALMRRRPVAVAVPAPLEYPRPVMPAGLSEEQQDDLLDRLMRALLTGRAAVTRETHSDVRVRAISGDDSALDDDVVEF